MHFLFSKVVLFYLQLFRSLSNKRHLRSTPLPDAETAAVISVMRGPVTVVSADDGRVLLLMSLRMHNIMKTVSVFLHLFFPNLCCMRHLHA